MRTSGVTLTTLVLAALLALAGPAGAAPVKKKPKKLDPTVSVVTEIKGSIAAGSTKTVRAECPRGTEVLGGSYAIGGSSLFAHASDAVPVPDEGKYLVSVTNPLPNPFSGIQPADATVRVTAECVEAGRPIVVDGRFGPAEKQKLGPGADTVSVRDATESDLDNGTVTGVQAKCPKGTSVFGGGYQTGGGPWAHASVFAVSSGDNLFGAVIVNPPFDPALGILRQRAAMRSTALCAKRGQPIVIGGEGSKRAVAAKKPKRKRRGTVKLVVKDLKGVKGGEVFTVNAACPDGYSVFGGDVVIGGDSDLAVPTEASVLSKANVYRVTVANPPADINGGIPKSSVDAQVGALCAKNGRPIVVDGKFPR